MLGTYFFKPNLSNDGTVTDKCALIKKNKLLIKASVLKIHLHFVKMQTASCFDIVTR